MFSVKDKILNFCDRVVSFYLKKRYKEKQNNISKKTLLISATERSDITVVLNGYKRPQYLKLQLDAINCQTIKPAEIMLWQNAGDEFDYELTNRIIHSKNNYNFGVWARFAYALNARTEYVCIFDDDTIPGNRWLENCLNTIKTHNGLLGTIGVIHLSGESYMPMLRYGWANPNEEVKRVDIVGHCWFFRRDWLSYFWKELPEMNSSSLVGEDIHFSAMLQRYGNVDTYVPPHPKDDTSLWGSLPEYATKFGQDNVAISSGNNLQIMNNALLKEIKKGFKLINSH